MSVGHRAELAALTAVFGLFRRLPEAQGRSFGRALGGALGKTLRRRDRLIVENLLAAFPEWTRRRAEEEAVRHWRQFGDFLWEYAQIPNGAAVDGLYQWEEGSRERILSYASNPAGSVMLTGHYANWEVMCHAVSRAGVELHVIARRIKNPLVDAFVTRLRALNGARVIQHRSAVRESMKCLRGGGTVGMLIDQRITAGGTLVPFFGRPAFTTTLPVLLGRRTGAPVYFILGRRENGRIHIRVGDPLDVASGSVDQAMARVNGELESWVRGDPSQWLWGHDRWKP